jgi:polysaccharide export outer membrane protein
MIATVLLATLMLLGCPADSAHPNPKDKSAPATTSPTSPASDATLNADTSPAESTYQIALNDVLHVSVWQEPELTSTLQVRTDGMISIPLINDVRAAGMTPMALAASISEKLKKYVDAPRVTVVVSSMRPPRIYLTGQVGHTGPMSLIPHMTVLQALVTAGLTPFANTKKIYVLRSVDGVQKKLPVNYKHLIKGQDVDQDILLKPEDMIVVP